MKNVFIGAVAIGGYLGCQLSKASQDITFIVRHAPRNVIDEEVLTLISPEGTDNITNDSTVGSHDEVDSADLVISASKIYGEPELPENLPAGEKFMTSE